MTEGISHRALMVCQGAMGMRRQLQAIALELQSRSSWHCEEWLVDLKWPWLPDLPPFSGAWLWAASEEQITVLQKDWDVVISCGRRSALVARLIQRHFLPKVRLVHVEDPRCGYQDFDLLLIPGHDQIPPRLNSRKSVVRFSGGLSPFACKAWRSLKHQGFMGLAKPRVALLLGGSGKGLHMTRAWLDALVSAIEHRKKSSSWYVTFSRRTPVWVQEQVRDRLGKSVEIWDGEDVNPYPTLIKEADVLVVSVDSTSMLLQAAASDARLELLNLEGERKKVTRLCQSLVDSGRATWFTAHADYDKQAPQGGETWNALPDVCDAITHIVDTAHDHA